MAKQRDPELLARLGTRFRGIRHAAGKTQEQVAEALGIQPTTLSRWERGRVGLSLFVLAKAADYFGIGLGDLTALDRDLPEVSPGERGLLEAWRGLDTDQRKIVQGMIDQMLKQG